MKEEVAMLDQIEDLIRSIGGDPRETLSVTFHADGLAELVVRGDKHPAGRTFKTVHTYWRKA